MLELMIVVSIIGVLASVATPKYVGLVDQAKDAATKSNLHNLKVAIHLYYAFTEGIWPKTLDNISYPPELPAFLPTYMERIPEAQLKNGLPPGVNVQSAAIIYWTGNGEPPIDNTGGWIYNPTTGEIKVNCTELDTKGKLKYSDY